MPSDSWHLRRQCPTRNAGQRNKCPHGSKGLQMYVQHPTFNILQHFYQHFGHVKISLQKTHLRNQCLDSSKGCAVEVPMNICMFQEFASQEICKVFHLHSTCKQTHMDLSNSVEIPKIPPVSKANCFSTASAPSLIICSMSSLRTKW